MQPDIGASRCAQAHRARDRLDGKRCLLAQPRRHSELSGITLAPGQQVASLRAQPARFAAAVQDTREHLRFAMTRGDENETATTALRLELSVEHQPKVAAPAATLGFEPESRWDSKGRFFPEGLPIGDANAPGREIGAASKAEG